MGSVGMPIVVVGFEETFAGFEKANHEFCFEASASQSNPWSDCVPLSRGDLYPPGTIPAGGSIGTVSWQCDILIVEVVHFVQRHGNVGMLAQPMEEQ